MEQENKEYHSIFDAGLWNLYLKNLDIKNLINICYQTKEKYNSVTKSNRGGYQSPDIIGINDSLFYPLISRINNEIQNHYKNPNRYIKDMWLNISSTTNYNSIHTHARTYSEMYHISGVLYIQTPQNSGNFTIYNPLRIDDQLTFTPIPGQLLLFNKVLPHSVSSNNSQDDRISIAFNCNI